MVETCEVLSIGAGPAGLTAAYILTKAGHQVTVLEQDPIYVGGISRTVSYKGFCFDIGGHRFFSKSAEIEALWREILAEDFLTRPRKSRIYYGGKLYPYPLKPFETLLKLGPIESTRCMWSFMMAQLQPYKDPKNFEEWVTNKFGARLFSIFFKTYTEKVWGMSCKEISADWAAQRIKGLSLIKAVLHAFLPQKGENTIKTLIDSFHYPRKGPGMMWDHCAEKIERQGGKVLKGQRVTQLNRNAASGLWEVEAETTEGKMQYEAKHVVCSAPLRETVLALTPALPKEALDAAKNLRYRDFLIVALILKERHVFDDNWIYIHDPKVKVGRIQNFKSWSPEMVPDAGLNCLGMEYFCFAGDGMWQMDDDKLVELAKSELVKLKLAKLEDIVEGVVVRQEKAYPVYDQHYRGYVDTIKDALAAHAPGLHMVGRNGMHKYNNQDHAMMTGWLAARNITAGSAMYDLWHVNQDAEYHEEGAAGDQREFGTRMVPSSVK